MTNWFRGIDESSSTPGGNQVALPNHYFVDASYLGTSTGSPSQPFTDLNSCLASIPSNGVFGSPDQNGIRSSSVRVIVASGNYAQAILGTRQFIEIIANVYGSVTFGDRSMSLNWMQQQLSFTFRGCAFLQTNRYDRFCYYDSCVWDIDTNVAPNAYNSSEAIVSNYAFYRNKFVSGDILIQGELIAIFNACTFNDTRIYYTLPQFDTQLLFKNSDFTAGSILEFSNIGRDLSSLTNCNFRGSFVNIEGGSTDIAEINPLTPQDPLWNGVPDRYEFYLQESSPLIGSGQNGANIGAYEIGGVIDLSVPDEINDITVGSTIEITDPATTGNIKPRFIQYSEPRLSPKFEFNGISDFANNVPDNESNTTIPKYLVVEVTTRQTIGGADEVRNFIYGGYFVVDNQGRGTGESNFNPFDVSSSGDIFNPENWDRVTNSNLLRVAEWQPNIVMNDQ